MDETGHAGHAVPGTDSGTNHPGEATPNGWANGSAQLRAAHNGSDWSPVGTALEPGTDALSSARSGAGGYEPADYPAPVTPVPTRAPASTGYPAPWSTEPAAAEPVTAADSGERAAADSWLDWQSTPLPPGHVPLSGGYLGGDEYTPPHGIPVAPPAGPLTVGHGDRGRAEHVQAEPLDTRHTHAAHARPEHSQDEPARGEPRRAAHSHGEPEPGEQPPADEWRPEVLPQRVPAQPDVPALPAGIAEEADLRAEAPELARIATYLRHDDLRHHDAAPAREAFDVEAVLAAVREVDGVRGAEVRRNPNGVHTLRLDLVDGADGGQVSRMVARLLSERMGLSASPGTPLAAGPPPPAAPPPAVPPPAVPPPAQPTRRYAGSGVRGRATVRPALPGDAVTGDSPPGDGMTGDGMTGDGMTGDGMTGDGMTGDEYHAAPSAPFSPFGSGQPAGSQRLVSQRSGPQRSGPQRAGRPLPASGQGVRALLDHVQVSTFGLDATVEVRLTLDDRRALGEAHGPAVDGYVLRLCAVSAAAALDQLLVDPATGRSRGRCFVEHAALVPFGTGEVAVAVVLLVCDGWVEQLAGAAIVTGDARQAVVRATVDAVNRRLENLLH